MSSTPPEVDFEVTPLANLPTIPKGASEALRKKWAKRGLEDIYFFCKTILGYKKLTPHTHGALCRFLDSCNMNRRAIEMPRSHYKTTIGTIGKNIQRACKNPNIRILIIAGTSQNAQRFMMEIRQHFESNELLKWLYSEVLPPDRNKVRWNDHEIELKRTEFWKEPTFDAIGAGAMVESRHYDVITGDDLIGWKQYNSDLEMEKIIQWSAGMEALLISPRDQIDIIGSLWKRGDIYDHLKNFFGGDAEEVPLGPHAVRRGEIAIFNRGCLDENGEPIFPEEITKEFLQRKMKTDPEFYAAQYANNPIAGGLTVFQKEWIRYFKIHESRQGKKTLILRSKDGTEVDRVKVEELEVFVVYDPAKSERKRSARNAIHVLGFDRFKGRLFVLESHVGMYKPDEAIDHLFNVYQKWYPIFISIESVGYQGAIKYWLNERSVRDKLPYLPVQEYHPGSEQDKEQRIRGLQPIMRVGDFWMQEDQVLLLEEITFFPSFRYRDALDALAQCLDYISNSTDQKQEEEDSAREEEFLKSIDETGYGIKPGCEHIINQFLGTDHAQSEVWN